MLRWLWRLFPAQRPLTGAPPRVRQKTYSAQSGYVYQYYYAGHRPAGDGAEHLFRVSADRRTFLPVAVVLEDAAVEFWERERGRGLNATERYAAVKLALFQAFDERSHPRQMREPVRVRAADLAGLLETLGIE